MTGAPDWRTDFTIYAPHGQLIENQVSYDNEIVITDHVVVNVTRNAENEALITVNSPTMFHKDETYALGIGDSIKTGEGYRVKLISMTGPPNNMVNFSISEYYRVNPPYTTEAENFIENCSVVENETAMVSLFENGEIIGHLRITVTSYTENKVQATVLFEPLESDQTGAGDKLWLIGLFGALIVVPIFLMKYRKLF
jgi:hypothetical protein